jgi:hypothetical protein
LLDRIEAGGGAIAIGKIATASRICVSVVQSSATTGQLLEMRKLQDDVRYLRNSCRLSILRLSVSCNRMPGLWEAISHERVERCRLRYCKGMNQAYTRTKVWQFDVSCILARR